MTESNQPLFDPKVFLAKVDGGRTIKHYRTNEIVFSQGDPCDAVFYIQSGKVKLIVLSDLGKEAVVAMLGADEFIGEACITSQPLCLASAVTATDAVVMRLEKGGNNEGHSSGACLFRILHRPSTQENDAG